MRVQAQNLAAAARQGVTIVGPRRSRSCGGRAYCVPATAGSTEPAHRAAVRSVLAGSCFQRSRTTNEETRDCHRLLGDSLTSVLGTVTEPVTSLSASLDL